MTAQNQGRQFEKELAEEFGLELVPSSGSVWYSKLDLKGRGARWSLKYTSLIKWPLTYEDIEEGIAACYGPGGDGSCPIWAVRIAPNEDYIILRKEDFKAIQKGDIKLIEEDRPHVAARKQRASQPELLRNNGDN